MGAANKSAHQGTRLPDPGPGRRLSFGKELQVIMQVNVSEADMRLTRPRQRTGKMRGLGLVAARASAPGKSQRFHCPHSHLQSRGQTSRQRAPQLQFSPAELQPRGEKPLGPRRWPGPGEKKPDGPQCLSAKGLGRVQVLGEKQSAPRGTSLVGNGLGECGRAQCHSGPGQGLQGFGWVLSNSLCAYLSIRSTSARCSAASSVLSACSSLRMGGVS